MTLVYATLTLVCASVLVVGITWGQREGSRGGAERAQTTTVDSITPQRCANEGIDEEPLCLKLGLAVDGRTATIARRGFDLSVGDEVLVRVPATGTTASYAGPVRTDVLPWALLVLVGICALVMGWQGIRAVLALCASVLVLLVYTVPGLIGSAPPALVIAATAILLVVGSMLITHGAGPITTIAGASCALSTLLVLGLGELVFDAAHITGAESEEVGFLLAAHPDVSARGLLLAGTVFAVIGVLDDLAVSQVSTVSALLSARPGTSTGELVARALRVGRDHATAAVNTLAFAYVGTSIGLLVLAADSRDPLLVDLNNPLLLGPLLALVLGTVFVLLTVVLVTSISSIVLTHDRLVIAEAHACHDHGEPTEGGAVAPGRADADVSSAPSAHHRLVREDEAEGVPTTDGPTPGNGGDGLKGSR